MISVLIISPGVTTRVGLSTLLMNEARIQVMGEVAAPEDVEAGQNDIDVIVWSPGSSIDQEMGAPELERLAGIEASAWVLIHDDPKTILPYTRKKFHSWGVLSPEASKEELVAAIEAVHEGLVVLNPAWAEYLSADQARGQNDSADMIETLTGREIEVLQLLAQGLTNKQIAVKLKISTHTVKFHVSSIFGKMGTTNRTETVKLGLTKGLILL